MPWLFSAVWAGMYVLSVHCIAMTYAFSTAVCLCVCTLFSVIDWLLSAQY